MRKALSLIPQRETTIMHKTRKGFLTAAHGRAWFQLNRHDDPDPSSVEPPDTEVVEETAEEPDPEGADQLGDAGKKALDKMKADKAAAKREAAAEKKKNIELASRLAEFEDRDKSDLDKATSRAEKLAEQAAKLARRAVVAEVKAAASEFADPEDAAAFLDLAGYASADGDIDVEAISADLEALLERKPHLRKATEAPKKKTPRPDPSQGPRPTDQPTDFRSVSREDLEAELANSVPGFRLR